MCLEWEAQGAYGCQPAQPGTAGCELVQGCISLISSGDDATPSFFLGASADGSNVFFGTHARLVAQDTDESGDLYDARIGGGFPGPGGQGSLRRRRRARARRRFPSAQTPAPSPGEPAATSNSRSWARLVRCGEEGSKERGRLR